MAKSATQDRGPIITLAEAGRQIGRNKSTISRWVRDGLLPSIRHPSGLPGVYQADFDRLYGTAKRLHAKSNSVDSVASVAPVANVAESV